MGLTELKFLYKTAFAGEVIPGMLRTGIAYYLIRFRLACLARKGRRQALVVANHGLIVILCWKQRRKFYQDKFIDEKEFDKWLISV
jgi:hypothetical protein